MKLKIKKPDDNLEVKIIDNDVEEAFNNFKLIEAIYNGESIDLEFEDGISEEDKQKIIELKNELVKQKADFDKENNIGKEANKDEQK